MDNKERFDQIEALLAELLRRADRQDEYNQRFIQKLDGIDGRLGFVEEKIDGIINVLKISADRQEESEKRQDKILAEIREQGRVLEAQGKRQDVAIDAIKELLKRSKDTNQRVDSVTESQRQLIQVTQLNTESLENQEPRIQRLEDEVFRQAS